jgi:soluble P-type ATPase
MSRQMSDDDEGKMLQIAIPGRDPLTLRHLALDLNGTLAVDGHVVDGVAARLDALRAHLQLHVLTAGTHGTHGYMDECAMVLGLQPLAIGTGTKKRHHVRTLGPEQVVALGNGANDVLMLREAALAIAVLGPEGLCADALAAADVVVADPCAGLDLLLHPARLVAALRP